MQLIKDRNIGGILLAVKHRRAGSFEQNGKTIEYPERFQLVVLTFESDNEIRKYNLSPNCEKKLLDVLDPIHWGALIELDLENREVIDITIVSDAFADFYDQNS